MFPRHPAVPESADKPLHAQMLIPANTEHDPFLIQITSENHCVLQQALLRKNRYYIAIDIPNFEFPKNVSLRYMRPQVLHRKGRLPACLQDFLGLFVTANQKVNLAFLNIPLPHIVTPV